MMSGMRLVQNMILFESQQPKTRGSKSPPQSISEPASASLHYSPHSTRRGSPCDGHNLQSNLEKDGLGCYEERNGGIQGKNLSRCLQRHIPMPRIAKTRDGKQNLDQHDLPLIGKLIWKPFQKPLWHFSLFSSH